MDIIGFYTNALGYSHQASQKPCQDNGRYFVENDVYIAVVCDGHGGDCYVRSDVGSRLAADVAVEKIQAFIKKIPKNLFAGKKGAVTVKPMQDPRDGKDGKRRDISALSESEVDLLRQSILYFQESQKNPDIEKCFRGLFSDICIEWKHRIEQDAKERSFTKTEKEKLGSRQIQKAYGTTLMAAVRTPEYWFAFHIGDGKLYACDDLMQWKEPVPWDCNCFMNTTTSLCGHSPVEDFRYAFDGTGCFPIAFALGSDGIDDTFLHSELIHKFYSQIMCVLGKRDVKEITELLKNHLGELSKRGSHDDMSVAMIIDKDRLQTAIQYYNVISEVRKINTERSNRQNDLEQLRAKREALTEGLNAKINASISKVKIIRKWWHEQLEELFKRRESNKFLIDDIKNSQLKIDELNKIIDEKEISLTDWKEANREYVSKLKEKADKIKEYVNSSMEDASNLIKNSKMKELDSRFENNKSFLKSVEKKDVCEDSPNEVYAKANEAKMSVEGIARMERESEAQAKELLNKEK